MTFDFAYSFQHFILNALVLPDSHPLSSSNTAYHELKRLIETPYPFPLIQMARTFLFAWVFTVPFALLKADYDFYEVFMLGFLLTYGFVGLERVSIEMEDPFGNDTNDFDDMGLAQVSWHITFFLKVVAYWQLVVFICRLTLCLFRFLDILSDCI